MALGGGVIGLPRVIPRNVALGYIRHRRCHARQARL